MFPLPIFPLTVARRYLFANPAQTALLIAGVALGVTAFVFITALISGSFAHVVVELSILAYSSGLDNPTTPPTASEQ